MFKLELEKDLESTEARIECEGEKNLPSVYTHSTGKNGNGWAGPGEGKKLSKCVCRCACQ